MTRDRVAIGVIAAMVILLALAIGRGLLEQDADPAAPTAPAFAPAASTVTRPESETRQGVLHGRVTTVTGELLEGRLRFGIEEEAFWSDYFNGWKRENPWLAYVPPECLPGERPPLEILGVKIARRKQRVDFGRPFMARFGDIARIEVNGRRVRVTMKSGTVFDLDRLEAGDIDDGVRVWDRARGTVDLDSLLIRSIELLPAPPRGAAPYRLHGTVRTDQGDFTGFVQWDREKNMGSDELAGRTDGRRIGLRFDTIRSIARLAPEGVLVTLLDGREYRISGSRETGRGNRGTYVDDRRYGRVLVSWDALLRADFSDGGCGPAYGDFPPGKPLAGSVTTLSGRRFAGRLVFDLDESETTETLDAPSRGVDYTIPFGLIASIVARNGGDRQKRLAAVTLHGGEELILERSGDLGEGNAGLLVFGESGEPPEYVPWAEVERVDFETRSVRLG